MNGASPPATVTELVEAQVRRTPDAPAVAAGSRVLSYAEFDRRANGLARRLQELGVGTDVAVAVLLERSLEMTVALLAIQKAGGACLPVDPAVPAERVAYLLTDSAAPVVLTQTSLLALVGAPSATVVCLDGGPDGATPSENGRGVAAPPRTTAAGDVAYVIYTSGSTGTPKGVMLTHGGLVHHHRAVAELYQLGPGDRVLQFCSPSFDVSVEEMFPTWSSGGTVVLRDDTVPILGRSWLEWLRRQRVTMLNLPTAYWHEWVRDLQALGEVVPEDIRLVTVGGEKALVGAYRTWLQVGGGRIRWVNAYGPTEATILATWFESGPGATSWDPRSGDDPPIGRPLGDTTVHVVDASGYEVAPGDAGELYLGGPGVARGYLHRPELTAERFVADQFDDRSGARLYRTGDQVRARRDGNLEFVGRLDQQVKVRGFRIECGEVESVLLLHPDVADAAVIAREDTPGARRLVAYVVGEGGRAVGGAELRQFLAQRLPLYMLPTAFVALDALPTTAGGKVDRRGLPAPVRQWRGTGESAATPTEKVLAAIWSQVLGLDGLDVDEDFFDLGGQSLLATQVVAQVRETLGREVPLRAIFEFPTVRALAAAVDHQGVRWTAVAPLVAEARALGEGVPLSLPQEQMWQLEVDASPPGLYNITALHRFGEPVDPAVVQRSLDYLIQRHDALRTSFRDAGGHVSQTVAPEATVHLAVTDLGGGREGEVERDLLDGVVLDGVARQDAEPFDLGRPPLCRARLFRLGDDRSLLAVTFDHLISDGTSAYIFLSELAEVSVALREGREPALPPLPVQYPDFVAWQRRWLTEDRQQAQLEYWTRALAGMPHGPAVPFDRLPTAPTRRIASRPLSVPPDAYRSLNRLARAGSATMFMVAVAVVDVVLHGAGGAEDVVVSTTLSGRQRAELDGVIGYFANVGRIRTDLSGDPDFVEIIDRARTSVLGLFEHQDIPFRRVRQALFPAALFGGAGHPLAALPIELQYFHAGQDGWAPGLGVVERPGPDKGPDQLFFRGQLHPLSISLLDDGSQLWGEINYKTDFYDAATIERLASGLEWLAATVATNPRRRLSELAAEAAEHPSTGADHRPVGTWRLEA